MNRTAFLVLLILLALAGFAGGYFLFQMASPVDVPASNDAMPESPVPGGAAMEEPTAQPPMPGFCCMAAGGTCGASKDPVQCLQAGGLVFHKEQSKCDAICAVLQK